MVKPRRLVVQNAESTPCVTRFRGLRYDFIPTEHDLNHGTNVELLMDSPCLVWSLARCAPSHLVQTRSCLHVNSAFSRNALSPQG